MKRFSLRTRFTLLIATFVVGLAVFATAAFQTVGTVKVNGPYYASVAQNKDLLADVLPPPAYLVEARLVSLEIANALRARDGQRVAALLDRYQALRSDFAASAERWSQGLPSGPIRDAFVNRAAPAGREFLELMDRDFVPAVRRGDEAGVLALLGGELGAAFEKHKTGIDAVVEAGQVRSREIELTVARVLKMRTLLLILMGLGVLIGVATLALWIVRSVLAPLATAARASHDLAEGDLTVRLDDSGHDELSRFSGSLNAAVAAMRDSLAAIQESSHTVASSAAQLSSGSAQIASGAQEQASSLEETAASLEEITSTVKQNADNAQQANQLASGAREVAEKGGQVVSSAVEAMSEINQSSKQIADIITTIDEIAFQTNLLALNAAVEAARAGEQGRGFAVVAAEVRNLAQRSATAAKEIKSLIQDSVRKVEGGSELVNQSGQTLNEIVTSVKRVTDIVAEIAAASREQSTGIDQVNKAITQMDQVTQANASQTEELNATAEGLASQAQQLQALVGRFKLTG